MRFLVIKAGHIGDALVMTPALQLLRDRFPGARIDVAVRRDTQGVLEANPCIDRLFLLPRPKTDGVREGRHPDDALRLYAGTINQRYDMELVWHLSRAFAKGMDWSWRKRV